MDYISRAEFVVDFLETNPKIEESLEKCFGKKVIGKGFWKYPRYDIMQGIKGNKELF